MNAPVTPTCCEACGESCDAIYDAPDDSGLICGACLDAALREDDETACDEPGPDYAPDVHGRW